MQSQKPWFGLFVLGMDPTWAKKPQQIDAYFARMTPNHIIVTRGRNLAALGSGHYIYFQAWPEDNVELQLRDRWEVVPRAR